MSIGSALPGHSEVEFASASKDGEKCEGVYYQLLNELEDHSCRGAPPKHVARGEALRPSGFAALDYMYVELRKIG